MDRLIEAFARMPGVGRRTAERFAFYILAAPREEVDALSKLLLGVRASIQTCHECFNLSDGPVCRVCGDPSRDHSTLCVVQDPKDVIAIEKAGDYGGLYHVLWGVLSPLEGIGPRDLKIKELLARIKKGGVTEVILATSSDTEGDATSLYLSKQLRSLSALGGKVRLTRIAHGVPVGSALEFADKATLSRALKLRHEV